MLAAAPIRVVLMGSGVFALPTLAELRKTGKNIVAVYTKPPKPAGRGHRLESTPVQKAAEHAKLLVRTPRTWYDCNTVREFSTLCADVAVVVDYGVILPKAVLDVPHWGCFNLHPSLLPRWRGSAPRAARHCRRRRKNRFEHRSAGGNRRCRTDRRATIMVDADEHDGIGGLAISFRARCKGFMSYARCSVAGGRQVRLAPPKLGGRLHGRKIDSCRGAHRLEQVRRAIGETGACVSSMARFLVFMEEPTRFVALVQSFGEFWYFWNASGHVSRRRPDCVWSWELAASIVAPCRRAERIHARLALRTPSCTGIDIAMSCGSAQERTSPA